jgi:hypothetical protein
MNEARPVACGKRPKLHGACGSFGLRAGERAGEGHWDETLALGQAVFCSVSVLFVFVAYCVFGRFVARNKESHRREKKREKKTTKCFLRLQPPRKARRPLPLGRWSSDRGQSAATRHSALGLSAVLIAGVYVYGPPPPLPTTPTGDPVPRFSFSACVPSSSPSGRPTLGGRRRMVELRCNYSSMFATGFF